MRIALDAMGSDSAPASEVKGAISALKEEPSLEVLLLGSKKALGSFSRQIADVSGLEVLEADQAVGMEEIPSEAFKAKRNSSIAKGLESLKQGKADGFVSAGNTGAVVAFSLFSLGRIAGVRRPALGAAFPTPKGHTMVLDVGANVETKPQNLKDYAVMGCVVMEKVFNISKPRVGLLNVGHEEGKGPQLARQAFRLLSEAPIRFVGNVEGSDVFSERAEVIVTDGFTGNVVLKFAEGMGEAVLSTLRSTGRKFRWRSWFSKKVFKDFIGGLSYEESGGAILLGVEGPVIVSHGRSSSQAIHNAIRLACFCVREGVVDEIKQAFSG